MHRSKCRGCLLGGAIGDALGYPIEFLKNIKSKEYTKYKNDKGIISDDTQMSLFTANGLLWRETRGAMRGISPLVETALYYAYLDWLETQDYTKKNLYNVTWLKNVSELKHQRAPGITCLTSLSSGKIGTLKEPINDSKGCGGVMRVAPIGLYLKNAETAGEYGAKSSAITHGHIYSSMASYVLASTIYFLSHTDIVIEDALNQSMTLMKKYFKTNKLCKKKDLKSFEKIINFAIDLSKQNIEDTRAIDLLGEGWVAEETLAIAIYSSLKYKNDFKSAIICAINHSGDSDSTGAVTGNILGAYLGIDKIPSYYIENLELKDIILEIADDLSIPVPISEYSSNTDKYWESKYIYSKRDLSFNTIV